MTVVAESSQFIDRPWLVRKVMGSSQPYLALKAKMRDVEAHEVRALETMDEALAWCSR
jgi:hypothetical protein